MLILLLTAACTTGPRQENPEDWTETEVNEWFASEEWLGESQVRPHASIDKRKLAIRYHKNKKRWDAAFEFIRISEYSTVHFVGCRVAMLVHQFFQPFYRKLLAGVVGNVGKSVGVTKQRKVA